MKKPKPCHVEWLDMKPTTGGRTCHKCEKHIVDFTKKSWEEIAAIQAKSGHSTCGMYTDKQLKYWGQNPPNRMNSACSRSLLMVSAMFAAIGQTEATTTLDRGEQIHRFILEKNTFEISGNKRPAPDTTGPISFSGIVMDGLSNEPLVGVNVVAVGTDQGVITGVDGRFEFDVSSLWFEWEEKKLSFTYTGYTPVEVPVHEFSEGKKDIRMSMNTEGVYITSFSVAKPSFFKRLKWKIKSLFR